MSLQSRDPATSIAIDSDVSNSAAQGLKVWNCTNCRRRKVRCDRKHPCGPCTKNKANCIFPVSGRVPRRSRDAHLKKQTELVGRLRRLEAMVGDLSSQVELSTRISQDEYDDVISSPMTLSNVESTVFNEKDVPDRHIDNNQSSGGSNLTAEELQNGYHAVNKEAEITQNFENARQLDTTSNGDIVVGNRFWTVFCKEVCFYALSFAQITDIDTCIWAKLFYM